MPTAAAMRAPTRASCWRRRRWRPRRGWTSAPTAPGAACASPTPAAWTTSRKPLDGLRGFLRLHPKRLEAGSLGQHLGGVLRGDVVQRAGVHLQRSLGVAETALVLAQDLRADHDVHRRVEQRRLAAVVEQLLQV